MKAPETTAAATGDPEKLSAALTDIFRRDAPDARIDGLRRLSGGASQETWSFDLLGPDGARDELILRRMPAGERPGDLAPGPEKEAAAITLGGSAGVPVPGVRYVLTPGDGVGRGFVMERIAGETLARRIIRDDLYAPARAAFAEQVGAVLARIHKVEADGIGLRLTTPSSETEDLWTIYQRSGTLRPVFELAFRWLREHVPAPVTACLVHGDFRNGNLIFAPDGIRAVLDWELMHLGDPVEDLAWLCVNSWRFGEIDKPAGGIATREALVTAYEAASGRTVDPLAMKFWEVLGTLRWGVACANMVEWIESGNDTSVERCMIARRASETEIDLLQLLLPMEAHHAG